jgi:hypothetical protein
LVWVIEDFRLAPPTFRWVGLAALETRKALIRSADNQRHLDGTRSSSSSSSKMPIVPSLPTKNLYWVKLFRFLSGIYFLTLSLAGRIGNERSACTFAAYLRLRIAPAGGTSINALPSSR